MSIRKIIAHEQILAAIQAIAAEIAQKHASSQNLVLAAIANGGIPLSEMLQSELAQKHGMTTHLAVIDISFHRDDIGVKPIGKEVEATQLALDPEESIIVLVDDVLFSGRSIRAALGEVHTLGRPQKIELAVLVDRGNRRLPIQPDYVGIVEDTTPQEVVDARLFPENPEKSQIDILSA